MAELKNYEEPFRNNEQELNNNNNAQGTYQNNIPDPNQNNLNPVNKDLKNKIMYLKIIFCSIMVILIIADIAIQMIASSKLDEEDPLDDSANMGGVGRLFEFLGLVSLELIIVCCSYCDTIPIIKIVIFILFSFFRWLLIDNNFFDEKVTDFYGIMLEIINFVFLATAISYQISIKIKLKLRF